ncbi:MAG: hypothetical protein AAF829_08095 [Pseudomonadota bacterium]
MTALVRTEDTAPIAPQGVVARDAQSRFLISGSPMAPAANDHIDADSSPSLLVSRRTRQRRRMARS